MNHSINLFNPLSWRGICKFVFALMCCVMIAMQSYGQDEAYAILSTDYETLTFYCDNQRANRQGTSFDLNNVGSTPKEDPQWFGVHNDDITKVVFDPSFKKARPQTCYKWFMKMDLLTDIEGIENLNTSEVQDMSYMFCMCDDLEDIDLSHFDTRKVTNMANMFQTCQSLNNINLSHFDTRNVTDMSYMFDECQMITNLNLSSFNTENVKDMSYMFFGMFNDQFTELDLSSFIVEDILQNTEAMFAGCNYLRTIKVSSGWKPSWVTDIESQYMFSECYALVGEQNTSVADVGDDKTIEYARIDGGPSRPGFFTTGKPCEPYAILSADGTLTLKFDENRPEKSYDIGYDYWQNDVDKITKVEFHPSFAYYRPTSCYNWFCKMENLEKIEGINEYLNTSQVTSMGGMFYQCYKLSGELNLSNFDTQNVTDMSNMFAFCGALTKIDISGFNTSSVTDMYWMFMNCGALETIEIGDEWNTGSVTKMSGLFGGCTNLKFDFTKLNTTSVIYMDYMLSGWNTTELDLRTFETGRVTTMENMFAGCRNLEILDLRSFNTENVVDMREMFSGCENLTTILVDPDIWSITSVDRSSIPPFVDTKNLIGNNGAHNQDNLYDYADVNSNNTYLTTDSYKIFYDLGEDGEWTGTEPQSSFDIDLKQDITITTKPTKKGYTFKGWYGTPITGLTEKNPQKNITIKAGDVGNRIYTVVWDKDAEPYAVLDNGTLTLYYNDSKPTTDNVYNPPSFDDEGNEIQDSRSWNWIASEVKTVDFDASFADYAPTNCTKWFANMINLTELKNTENFNTSQVESMEYMFGECESLTNLDLSFLNTDNVTNMHVMFLGCKNLKELNLSSFNTSKVQNMEYMFTLCKNLTTIYVDEWKLTDGLLSTNMFALCDNLHGGECTTLIGNKVDAEYARIDGVDGKLGYFTKIGEAPCTNDKAPYGVLDDGTLTLVYTGIKPTNGKVFDITETFAEGVYDGNVGWSSDDAKSVNKVVFDQSFEYYYPKSCHSWFANMENLTTIENIEYLNTDSVRNMQGLFMFCPFEVLDLSSFNTKYVKNMSGMFAWCPNLKTIFVGDDWSTESVTLGNGMFLNCSPNLRGGQCTSYKDDKIDVAYARIDGGESAPGYFTKIGEPVCDKNLLEAYVVVSTDSTTLYFYYDDQRSAREGVEGWTHGIEDRDEFGYPVWVKVYSEDHGENGVSFGADGLNDKYTKVVFVSSFQNALPTNTSKWFNSFRNLTGIVGIEYLNTSFVTDMSEMFCACSSLTTLDVSIFSTENVTDMEMMFFGCSSLTTLDVSNFNTGNVTDMHSMFDGCSTLTTLDVSHFNTENVTDMMGMFSDCSSLTALDVSHFNTDNVTNMWDMFFRCSSLTSLDVSHFNTDNVTNMQGMFSYCDKLTNIDVRSFNTGNVTNMIEMFGKCSSLTTLDLSNFNTDNVTEMLGLFYGCSNLKTIYVSDDWSTSSVTSSENMFRGCDNLRGGQCSAYSELGVSDASYARIDGGESAPGYFTKVGEPVCDKTIIEYTLSFDTNGGSTIESITKEPGAEIVPPANPTKDGYDFVRWEPELPKQMPDSDMVVKAVWAKPSVKPALNLPQSLSFPAIPQQPESFCQGDEKSAILKFTPTGITVTDYELSIADIITSDAHPAMDMTINGKDTTYTIKIDIPENQIPGVYHGTIKLFAKDNPTPYEESVTVEVAAAKDIVLYLYEDVIFVDNCKELYQKDQWQWYKNGSPIKNANRQFYFELPLNGSYMAEMKSVKDGLTVYSCPVVATIDLSKNATQPVKSYPNPAVSGQPVSLYIVNYNADTDYTISLSNSNGVIVNTIPHAPETSVITLPRGIYSGALISGGSKKGFKLIVR